MKHLFFYSLIIGSLVACKPTASVTNSATGNQQKLDAVLWQQTSAEYDALCYQAYNSAKTHLEKYTSGEMEETGLPFAIIMDLDETVLDNSPYNGWLLKNNKSYSEVSWNDWVKLEKAEAVPGAVEFIEMVNSIDMVQLFFVSNRSELVLKETLRNLEKLKINVPVENVFLKQNTSSKIERREFISSNHEIVMLIGDNLADFETAYEEGSSLLGREELTTSLREKFGVKYIILPNPMYGDWEKAIKSNGSDGANSLKAY